MKKIIKLLLLLVIISTSLIAQKTTNVVLLSGKITDINNNPISVEIFFSNENGDKRSSKSNSQDGSYSLILNPGSNYFISIRNHIVVENNSINIPNSGQYKEMSLNIKAKKYEAGMEIKRFNPFQVNSENINNSDFTEIKEFLANNRTSTVQITINANDCSFKAIKKKVKVEDKKKKNKTKDITITAEEQATELLMLRSKKIQNYFITNNIPERNFAIVIDNKYSPAISGKTDKKSKAKVASPVSPIVTAIAKISKVGL
jgi:hypothetical protein